MEWNRETILHFINLIKQKPAIWDPHSPEHKSKRKRFAAIEEVALLMGVAPKEVNTKWIILRNQYCRERRKIIDTENEPQQYKTKWYAYKDMDALMERPRRKRLDNFWNRDTQSDDEQSSPSSPPAPPAPISRPSVSGIQQRQPTDAVTQNAMSIYNQAMKTLKAIREQKNEASTDELTNYGLYIAGHLRKFSLPLQSRAKYEINKILYALDLESMGEYSATIPTADGDDDDAEEGVIKECKFDPLQSQKE